jgi:hypothetical protein
MLLGISPPWNWGENFFHIGTGADIRPKKNTVGKSLQAF